MKIHRINSTVVACAAIFTVSEAEAVVVAEYSVTGGFLASSDSDAGSTDSDVSIPGSPTILITSSELLSIRASSSVGINSRDDAVTNNISFSLTVTPGAQPLDFTSFGGDVGKNGSTSTRGWRLVSSLTGATVLAENTNIAQAVTAFSTTSGSTDLSGVTALQGVTTPVTFTFYANTGSGTGNNGRSVDFDNLVFNANVPESGSAAVGMISLIALLRRKRA